MNIENQVCTLEQAKKLRELGIEQNSLLYYVGDLPIMEDKHLQLVVASGYSWTDFPGYGDYPIQYSAFTVAELGVMLQDKQAIPVNNGINMWHTYATMNTYTTEAKARAASLIYLLENNHITALEVNNRLTTK